MRRQGWWRPKPAGSAPPGQRAYLAPDPLRVAAEVVTALADAVVVRGLDRFVLTANRPAAR